jgi:hypothetical protein
MVPNKTLHLERFNFKDYERIYKFNEISSSPLSIKNTFESFSDNNQSSLSWVLPYVLVA